jgi:hypothetical protein
LEALHPQPTDEVVAELAHHFEAAADWPRAVAYLRLEAHIAKRRFAHSRADSLLQRARQLASQIAVKTCDEDVGAARRQTAGQARPEQLVPAAPR